MFAITNATNKLTIFHVYSLLWDCKSHSPGSPPPAGLYGCDSASVYCVCQSDICRRALAVLAITNATNKLTIFLGRIAFYVTVKV